MRSNVSSNVGGSSSRGSNNYEQRVLDINTIKVESLQRQQQQRRIDLYTYLQLANGYYERGLHANIKYLQSIGHRNAIKQQQQQEHQQQQQQQQRLKQQQQRRYSLEAWPQQQTVEQQQPTTTTATAHRLPGRLSAILKSLRHRQRCQTGSECSKAAIRVHIAPVQQQQQQRAVIDAKSSMYDYADNNNNNKNNNNINNHNNSSSNSSSDIPAESVQIDQHHQQQQQRKLYAIIDNLSQLSLCDNKTNDRRLPLITLTDYTQQVALYGANFDIVAVAAAGSCQMQMQIPNEARPPT